MTRLALTCLSFPLTLGLVLSTSVSAFAQEGEPSTADEGLSDMEEEEGIDLEEESTESDAPAEGESSTPP